MARCLSDSCIILDDNIYYQESITLLHINFCLDSNRTGPINFQISIRHSLQTEYKNHQSDSRAVIIGSKVLAELNMVRSWISRPKAFAVPVVILWKGTLVLCSHYLRWQLSWKRHHGSFHSFKSWTGSASSTGSIRNRLLIRSGSYKISNCTFNKINSN